MSPAACAERTEVVRPARQDRGCRCCATHTCPRWLPRELTTRESSGYATRSQRSCVLDGCWPPALDISWPPPRASAPSSSNFSPRLAEPAAAPAHGARRRWCRAAPVAIRVEPLAIGGALPAAVPVTRAPSAPRRSPAPERRARRAERGDEHALDR